MTIRSARVWHGLTAVVTIASLLPQLVLVIRGGQVLNEVEPPSLGIRLVRFQLYFTIQSNILVAVVTTQLARDPLRDGPLWRAVRLAAVVGITVTGVVHFFLLGPLIDLEGADLLADKLVHMVVPVLAVVGWAVFGPRPRIDGRGIMLAICWPLAWLAWTLVVGWLSGWYPYPFLDHREEHGTMGVVLTSAAITGFFLALFAVARYVDERARPQPQAFDPYRSAPR